MNIYQSLALSNLLFAETMKLKNDNTKKIFFKKGQYLPSKSLQDHSLNKVCAMYILVFSDGILLSYKKSEIMPFEAIWIYPEIIILSQRNKYIRQILYFLSHQGSPSLTCGI